MAETLRVRVEAAARSYASACANHQHDKQKPGGSRDSRNRQWDNLAALLSEIDEMDREALITRGWMLKGPDDSPEQGVWLGWRVHANESLGMIPVKIVADNA